MFKKRAQFGQRKKKRKQPDADADADAEEPGQEELGEAPAGAGAGGARGAADNAVKPAKKAKKKKAKKQKGKTAGSRMLSFGDEQEVEGDSLPVLKKVANPSLASFRRSRAEEDEATAPAPSSAGMYSAESLKALQESSFSYGGGHVPVYKPAEDEDAVVEEDGAAEGDLGAGIPDASSIQRAREKRERLRKQGDYIPLEGEGAQGEEEEAADDDDDDDDGADLLADPADAPSDARVVMRGGATPRAARKRAEVKAALADGADFYRGDDELQRLEAQHVRSAMTGAVPAGRDSLNLRDTSAMGAGGLRGQSQRQSSLKEIRIDDVCRTLRSALQQQEEQLGRHQRELVTNAEASKLTAVDLESLNSKLTNLEPKYQYLQELWLYVDSMTACLDSKMGLIEECEVQLLELEKSEAEAAAARRWLLLEDLADTLSDGASTAAHDTAGSSRSSKRVELDEFGRDRNHTTKAVLSAGAGKRAEERRAMVERLRATDEECDTDEEEEGQTDHSKSIDERERVVKEKAEILQAASVIFADAAEEFSTVAAVASRMEEWKHKQPRSYHDTYVSINLLKIFSPFARLDLLAWHPSDRCIEALAQQGWFVALENYGMGGDAPTVDKENGNGNSNSDGSSSSSSGNGGQHEIAADDLDLELIPSLVEKVVIPRLMAWLRTGWDPLSRRSNDVALSCVNELTEVYVTVEKPAMIAVLATVLNRLQSTGDRIRILTPGAAPSPSDATGTGGGMGSSQVGNKGAIANYLFNRATGFVRNAVMWSHLLAAGPLEALVANVVGNHLCPVLACTQTIPTERSGEEWLPKLQRLVRALTSSGAPADGADRNSWLASTNMLRHVVRAAVTGSPRVQTLLPEESAMHDELASLLP